MKKPPTEIRLGAYQSSLVDVECDAVITDPPYGPKTHGGALGDADALPDGSKREQIAYAHWTPEDVDAFTDFWCKRTRCWIVALTSHDLVPHYLSGYEANGWYAFAPLAVVVNGMGVRIQGDGPASWTLHLCVARRRANHLSTAPGAKGIWRSLPGGYHGPAGKEMAGGRGKPAWLMEALVRDYSDPGMLVCDPCAGWGSTLLAAKRLGRRCIGAEVDKETWAVADRRLRQEEAWPDPKQTTIFDAVEVG